MVTSYVSVSFKLVSYHIKRENHRIIDNFHQYSDLS